jgi:hypothetical protein
MLTQRLLCAECHELRRVVERNGDCRLECGHTRDAGLLPKRPGALSIEALASARSAADRKILAELFPVSTANEKTSRRHWMDLSEAYD